VADYARLAKHFTYCLVRRAGRVVQVTVSSDRLLKEPGDMLDVGWGNGVVSLLLRCRRVLRRG
jgi:hypothetical protein